MPIRIGLGRFETGRVNPLTTLGRHRSPTGASKFASSKRRVEYQRSDKEACFKVT